MSLPTLPTSVRRLTPARLRDDLRLRALAVGCGLIPPRAMHSDEDAAVLLSLARDARRVVEIGVYEGASAIALCRTLPAGAELHLVDPFGRHPDALPSGWGATEWATRRAVARALHARGTEAPAVHWHTCLSADLARAWRGGEADLVFVDGDHSEAGCELDWSLWRSFVPIGGHIVFHDARSGLPRGRGLPGPTAVVNRHFRMGGQGGVGEGGAGVGSVGVGGAGEGGAGEGGVGEGGVGEGGAGEGGAGEGGVGEGGVGEGGVGEGDAGEGGAGNAWSGGTAGVEVGVGVGVGVGGGDGAAQGDALGWEIVAEADRTVAVRRTR